MCAHATNENDTIWLLFSLYNLSANTQHFLICVDLAPAIYFALQFPHTSHVVLGVLCVHIYYVEFGRIE